MNTHKINTRSINRVIIIIAASAILLFGQPVTAQLWKTTQQNGRQGTYITGEVLVKFKEGTPIRDQLNVMEGLGHQHIKALDQFGVVQQIELKGDQSVDDAIASYQDNPNVAYAQPNFIYQWDAVPNDTLYGELWGLKNSGQTITAPSYMHNNPGIAGMDMDMELAWDYITDCHSMIVAVIDSGINYTHMDLAANMWDGGAGYPNHGWDFAQDDNDPMPADGDAHGTHVAGIIGAVGNNAAQTTGICWDVELMALRAGGASGSTTANIIQSIDFAIANGAMIINMSLGNYTFDQLGEDAINLARNNGILVVASAGNAGSDNDQIPHYPSDYDLDNIISVAALDQAYELADFSNYGADSVDVGSPGTNILSTFPGLAIEDDFSMGWTMTGDWSNVLCNFGDGPFDMLVNPSDWCSDGTYDNNADDRAYKQFDLNDYFGANLQYIAFMDTEIYFDYFRVAARNSGGDPFASDTLLLLEASGSTILSFEHDLSECLSATCSIGFQLTSDYSITRNGIGLYYFQIQTVQPNSTACKIKNGTSMAAPHVAGLAALIWAYNPDYDYLDVAESIKNGGEVLPILSEITTTGRAVNAMGSLSYIKAPTGIALSVN